jgi:hypothetical protein
MKSKYHNKKVMFDGIIFDSKKERDRYKELSALEDEGKISNLRLQVPYVLIPKQELPKPVRKSGRMKYSETACRYVADFVYIDAAGNEVVEDAKGMRTAEYNIKRKLMLMVHGIQIMEI